MKMIENIAFITAANQKSSTDVKRTAPIQLTVEQIAEVAAGFTAVNGPTTIAGGIRVNPIMTTGAV